MPRVILTLAIIGVAVFALADLANTPKEETGGLPKWLWAVLIVIVPVIGGLGWIVFRQSSRTTTQGRPLPPTAPRGRSTGDTGRPGKPHPGPVAPDDDPEFLWRLAQEQKRRRHDTPREGSTGEPGDPKP